MKKIAAFLLFSLCFSLEIQAQETPKAKVVLFRTFNFFEPVLDYTVYNNQERITNLAIMSLNVTELEAKPTRLWAKTIVKRHIDLDLKPNHIYIVRGRMVPGFLWGRPNFETLNVEEFKALVARRRFLQNEIKRMGFESVDDFLIPYESVKFASN